MEHRLHIVIKYEKDYLSAFSLFTEERSRFYKELKNIEYLRVIPSHSNYFLCEVTSKLSAFKLTNTLLKSYNILIKDCSGKTGFNQKDYVRIAVRSNSDNDKLIKALKEIANEDN